MRSAERLTGSGFAGIRPEKVLPRGEERSTEYAYRRLKAGILEREFAPGSYVLEKDAADRLGISRTPVREAMVRLAQD